MKKHLTQSSPAILIVMCAGEKGWLLTAFWFHLSIGREGPSRGMWFWAFTTALADPLHTNLTSTCADLNWRSCPISRISSCGTNVFYQPHVDQPEIHLVIPWTLLVEVSSVTVFLELFAGWSKMYNGDSYKFRVLKVLKGKVCRNETEWPPCRHTVETHGCEAVKNSTLILVHSEPLKVVIRMRVTLGNNTGP